MIGAACDADVDVDVAWEADACDVDVACHVDDVTRVRVDGARVDDDAAPS